MPTEAKPLFRADALRPTLVGFGLPAGIGEARKQLGNWINLLADKKAEQMKETELLPGFTISNGGLFAHADLLDRLKVPDEICKGLDRLAAYEYRPPALDDEIAPGTAPKLIDVEIQGHIFEQSISDLEQSN